MGGGGRGSRCYLPTNEVDFLFGWGGELSHPFQTLNQMCFLFKQKRSVTRLIRYGTVSFEFGKPEKL